MEAYSVTFAARAAGVDEGRLEAMLEALDDHEAIVGTAFGGTVVEASFIMEASSPPAAIFEGARVWEKGLAAAGLMGAPIVNVEAKTLDYLDAENATSEEVELVGVGEIAQMLRLSPQRASSLARTGAFPPPLADLRSGPVFARSAVERFAEAWERRPGRPRGS